MGNNPSVISNAPEKTINDLQSEPLQSEPQQPKPQKKIIAWPLPDGYVYPNMNDEIPVLKQYCDAGSGGDPNNFHCRNLGRVYFRMANYEDHKECTFFKNATEGLISYGSLEKDTECDIGYHVKHLMEYDQHPAVIADTCEKFSIMCNSHRYQNNTPIGPTANGENA